MTPKTCLLCCALLSSAACFGNEKSDSNPPPSLTETQPIQPYTSCESDEDCGDKECVAVLGAKVCAQTGCVDDEGVCPNGTTCVVSAAVAPTGMCALTGSNTFCARECSNILQCNLEPECAAQGCCSELDENGCPVSCTEMDPMSCEISPQCPVECCAH